MSGGGRTGATKAAADELQLRAKVRGDVATDNSAADGDGDVLQKVTDNGGGENGSVGIGADVKQETGMVDDEDRDSTGSSSSDNISR